MASWQIKPICNIRAETRPSPECSAISTTAPIARTASCGNKRVRSPEVIRVQIEAYNTSPKNPELLGEIAKPDLLVSAIGA
jgi:hypothetical protein